MKIVYFTEPNFLDCDLPLIREFQKANEVMVFIPLPPCFLKGSLLNIKQQIKKNGIIPASCYAEMNIYSDYLDLKGIYFLNRIKNSQLSLGYFRMLLKMKKMIDDFNPDVVHTTKALDVLEMILYKYRKKMCLTMHDPFLHSGKSNFRKKFFRKIAISITPKIVLLNKVQKDKFIETYNINPQRVLINKLGIYDTINTFKMESTKKSNINFNILFFGFISSYKGLEYLCEAMRTIHSEYPNITLTIAGSGSLYFDFSVYQNLPCIQLINRYIEMNELARLLDLCSVVACPYKDATQSGVIMTSFAKNRPIIATNVGALGEQIENGKTGVLVPSCDSKSLAKAIIYLYTHPETLKQMRINIANWTKTDGNSWSSIAEKYVEFYKYKL